MTLQSKVKSMEGFVSCTCPHHSERGAPSSLTSLTGVMGIKPLRWILGHRVHKFLPVRYAPYRTNRLSANPMRQSGVVDNRPSQSIPQNLVEQDSSALFFPLFSQCPHYCVSGSTADHRGVDVSKRPHTSASAKVEVEACRLQRNQQANKPAICYGLSRW